MRRLRLFGLANSAMDAVQNGCEATLSHQMQALPAAAELLKLAEESITIAKSVIEPLLKNPAVPVEVTEDLIMALRALKNAAETYEEIEAWNDAVFAWSMIEAVPVNSEKKWNASEKIQLCQRHIQAQLVPHSPACPPHRSV